MALFERDETEYGSDVGTRALSVTAVESDFVERVYERLASVYDLTFGPTLHPGRLHARERMVIGPGDRILEVGVGTGISLPDYARSNRLVGIDISAPMLRKAKERVDNFGLSNVEALAVMDAKHLAFPDDSFDVIVAQYVITAVPDPEATLDEFARVLKPGGEIVLVNHIGAENGARKAFELAFAPLARRLGWRPEFPWARLTAWQGRMPGIHFIERKPMPPLGHFSLIRYGKEAVAS